MNLSVRRLKSVFGNHSIEIRKILTIQQFIHSTYIHQACYMPDVEVMTVSRVETIPSLRIPQYLFYYTNLHGFLSYLTKES